jgi:hypothetical protein
MNDDGMAATMQAACSVRPAVSIGSASAYGTDGDAGGHLGGKILVIRPTGP